MHKRHLLFVALGAAITALTTPAFGQSTAISFDTADQYTSNFNEILNRTSGASSGSMSWSAPGVVQIQGGFPSLAPSVGSALYNPNAGASLSGPTFLNLTTALDAQTNNYTDGAITIGILARVQANGHAVYASYYPSRSGVSVLIQYGQFGATGPVVEGTLYSTNLGFSTFAPPLTHLQLIQQQINGVPTFDFSLSDNRGHSFDTGPVSLTGTTVYNNPGEVGFNMQTGGLGAGNVDNFTVSSAVPEPGTWALCGLGLTIGGAWVRNRRRG